MVEKRAETTWVRIQEEPLPVDEVADFVRCDDAGGVDIFLGTTRRWTGRRETVLLEYECYEPMAMAEMKRLLDRAQAQWPIQRACLLHRTGAVPLSEISVIVAVSTPHRDAAFQACRFLIDELKERVPIWKKERFADGESEWVQGALPPVAAESQVRSGK